MRQPLIGVSLHDKNQEAQMSKVIAISKEPRKYIPESCKDMESPPSFTIRSISKREYLKILAESDIKLPKNEDITEESNPWPIILSSYETQIKILILGVLGWENVNDNTGKEVPFSHENLDLLSDEIMNDLVKDISGVVVEKDTKNSVTLL